MIGRPFPGLLACALVVSSVFGTFVLAPASAEPVRGGAYITTLPSGADVFFDGTYVGRSPLVVEAAAQGHHGLTITRAGFASVETSVTIEPGTIVTSSTRLGMALRGAMATEPGTLALRAMPPHARASIDGTPVAGKDSVSLAPGPHVLVVETPRGRETRRFSIYPGTTTDVLVSEAHPLERRTGVVALAEDYLPTDDFAVDGNRIVVRYLTHRIVAHFGDNHVRMDGETLEFDSSPQSIGGKLYLPLALLEKVTGDVSKSR